MFRGVENPLQRSEVFDQLKHTSVERYKIIVHSSDTLADELHPADESECRER